MNCRECDALVASLGLEKGPISTAGRSKETFNWTKVHISLLRKEIEAIPADEGHL